MDWLLDVFATWLYGLKVIAITLAVIMFISGLDDFFIDVVYWVRRIKRKLSVYRRYPRMSYRELYKPDEKPLAIMVPAWNETGVIGNMVGAGGDHARLRKLLYLCWHLPQRPRYSA